MKPNLFTQIQIKKPPRSAFDLSHQRAQTGNYGILYPCLVLDLVPGDSVNLSCDALIRCAPLVTPMMNRNDIYVHYWFVPNRLLWEGWEGFITQQPYNDVEEIPVHPYVDIATSSITEQEALFLTYFGLPDGLGQDVNTVRLNPFAFAAYQMIYNEWYRDQNLIDPVLFELIDGDNSANLSDLIAPRRRAWEHDYLTSALPFAQKGPAVSIPLGNVTLKQPWDTGVNTNPRFVAADGDPDNGALAQAATLVDPTNSWITIAGNPKYAYNPDGTLIVAPTSINDLRRAYRLQEWYEKQARGGTRYIEVILSHFGIKSSDARLQRPEYITGARQALSITEVLQTSETESTPQGNLAGHGITGLSGNYGRYFAEEHGHIIGILSIMPKAQYSLGIHKRFLKFNDPFEYYWPEFANIGEQAIQYQEVTWLTSNPMDGTFGYIPRYAEYKFENNVMAGEFARNNSPWVQPRNFANNVALNKEFIECNPDYQAFAVTSADVDHFYINMWHNIRAVRPMPYYGTPTI